MKAVKIFTDNPTKVEKDANSWLKNNGQERIIDIKVAGLNVNSDICLTIIYE